MVSVEEIKNMHDGSDRRSPSLGGPKEVSREEGERWKSVLRRLAHKKRKGKLLLLIFGGRTLAYSKYMKADYNYQPFLRPCKKNMNEENKS
jgi:hypothetical protein